MTSTTTILAILALLGCIGLVVLLLVGAGIARLNGRATAARQALSGAGLLTFGYGTVLIGAGLSSRERVLPVGTPKYFCEIDCHVTHAVIEAAKTDTLDGARAEGIFYLVKVRTWFDPSTTSPSRPKDAVVYPNPRAVWLVDAAGRRYPPSAAGMAALAQSGLAGTPIDQPLLPDASYTTEYAFDVPAGVEPSSLWIAPADPVSRFLIGQELSPWHAKVLQAIPAL